MTENVTNTNPSPNNAILTVGVIILTTTTIGTIIGTMFICFHALIRKLAPISFKPNYWDYLCASFTFGAIIECLCETIFDPNIVTYNIIIQAIISAPIGVSIGVILRSYISPTDTIMPIGALIGLSIGIIRNLI